LLRSSACRPEQEYARGLDGLDSITVGASAATNRPRQSAREVIDLLALVRDRADRNDFADTQADVQHVV